MVVAMADPVTRPNCTEQAALVGLGTGVDDVTVEASPVVKAVLLVGASTALSPAVLLLLVVVAFVTALSPVALVLLVVVSFVTAALDPVLQLPIILSK